VFEDKELRRIFGFKNNEIMGDWRKLHNEEHHIVYSSPYIIRMIKSRWVRWAWHVACMGRGLMLLAGKPAEKRNH
jgi:hypothetical protein